MAAQQDKRHKLGRKGERVVQNLLGGKMTNHTAPFDVVNFALSEAYEVKAMSGTGIDLKVHISDASMARKQAFIDQYEIQTAWLIAVVIHNSRDIDIYRAPLQQHIRISAMEKIR